MPNQKGQNGSATRAFNVGPVEQKIVNNGEEEAKPFTREQWDSLHCVINLSKS